MSSKLRFSDERRLLRKIAIDETTRSLNEVQDLHSKTSAIPTSARNKTLKMKKVCSKPTAADEKVRKVLKTSKSSTQDVFTEEEQLKHFGSEADEKVLLNENITTKPTAIKKLHSQEKELFKKSKEEKLTPTEFKLKNKQEGDFDLISETFTSEGQFTKQPGVQVSREQKKEAYRIKHSVSMKVEPSKHLYDETHISVSRESSISEIVVEIKKKIPTNLSQAREKTHLRNKDSDLLGEEKQQEDRKSVV